MRIAKITLNSKIAVNVRSSQRSKSSESRAEENTRADVLRMLANCNVYVRGTDKRSIGHNRHT